MREVKRALVPKYVTPHRIRLPKVSPDLFFLYFLRFLQDCRRGRRISFALFMPKILTAASAVAQVVAVKGRGRVDEGRGLLPRGIVCESKQIPLLRGKFAPAFLGGRKKRDGSPEDQQRRKMANLWKIQTITASIACRRLMDLLLPARLATDAISLIRLTVLHNSITSEDDFIWGRLPNVCHICAFCVPNRNIFRSITANAILCCKTSLVIWSIFSHQNHIFFQSTFSLNS